MLRVTVAVPALVTDVAWWRRWWWSVIGLRLFFALFLWSCAKTRRTNQTNERKNGTSYIDPLDAGVQRHIHPKTIATTTTLLKSQTHYALYSLLRIAAFNIDSIEIHHPSIHPSIHRSHPYPYPSTTSNVKWLWRQKKNQRKKHIEQTKQNTPYVASLRSYLQINR